MTDFISWVAGKHPDYKNIFASFSDRLGVRANLRLQRILTRKTYKDIFPKTKLSDKGSGEFTRNRNFFEFVEEAGSFRNTTVGGMITGESLDIGFIDDPLKGREAANSETIRNKTWDWFTDDFYTRFSESAGLLMILTRWHIDDPAARLKDLEPNTKVFTYKAIAENDEEHRKQGEALIPEHKSIEFLNKRKIVMGANFEALYQQNPIIKGGNILKSEWIKWVDPYVMGGIQFERKFITADTALKDKQKNDYTVYSAWGVYQNKLYWLDMYRGKPKSTERELFAEEMHNKWNTFPFEGMHIEQKASGVDLFQRMQDKGFMVFEVERNTDKVYRAETVSPYIETHGLYISSDIPHKIDLVSEYEAFYNAPHDDIVDTMMDAIEICYKGNMASAWWN